MKIRESDISNKDLVYKKFFLTRTNLILLASFSFTEMKISTKFAHKGISFNNVSPWYLVVLLNI